MITSTDDGDDALNLLGPTVWRNLHLSAHLIQMQLQQCNHFKLENKILKIITLNQNFTSMNMNGKMSSYHLFIEKTR